MNTLRALIATSAILCGTVTTAQTATNTMTVKIDGSQTVLSMSPTFARAPSSWSTFPAADHVDEIQAIGYLLEDDALEMQVNVYFVIWNLSEGANIEQPSIEIVRRDDTGRWETMEQEDPPIVTLTTYDRSDAGLLIEAAFSGNSVYWPTIYKKPEDRGPSAQVSGEFSIFYPVD